MDYTDESMAVRPICKCPGCGSVQWETFATHPPLLGFRVWCRCQHCGNIWALKLDRSGQNNAPTRPAFEPKMLGAAGEDSFQRTIVTHRESCPVNRPDYGQMWPVKADGTIDESKPHPYGGCNCDFMKRLAEVLCICTREHVCPACPVHGDKVRRAAEGD